jgi:long-chain acyl-CoA synthetase
MKEEAEIPEEDIRLIESPAGRKVISSLERITEKKNIMLDHNLELDLGIDSLSRVELMVTLSRAFSIELPDTFGADVYSVRDLILKMESFQRGGGKEALQGISGKWEDLFKTEPSAKDKEAVGFIQGPLTKLLIIFLIGLLRIIGRVFFRLEIKGLENIPSPPYIITPNHASNLDGFFIGIGVQIRSFMILYFLGFQKYFANWFTSRFARFSHVIPVDPETYLKRALQISGYVLKKGKSLCIFPEGGRTYDGNLMPFKKGVGILSKELNVSLIPTLIEGTFEALLRVAFDAVEFVHGRLQDGRLLLEVVTDLLAHALQFRFAPLLLQFPHSLAGHVLEEV